MKRRIYITITLILMILIFSTFLFVKVNRDEPLSFDVISSLEEWDFAEQKELTLKGEWEFYEEQLLTPEEIKGNNFTNKENVIIDKNGFSFEGKGTYRLNFNLGDNYKDLGLKVVNQYFVYSKIWVNGLLINKMGSLEDLENKKPWDDIKAQRLLNAPTRYGQNEIVIQLASDFTNEYEAIVIGNVEKFNNRMHRITVRDYSLVTISIILGLYHLMLAFLYANNDKGTKKLYFSFAMYVIFNSIQVLILNFRTQGNNYIDLINFFNNDTYLIYFALIIPRIIYTFFMYPFWYYLFYGHFSRKSLIVITTGMFIANVVSLFSVIPGLEFLYNSTYYLNLASLLFMIIASNSMAIMMIKRRQEVRLAVLALITNIITTMLPLNDILVTLDVLDTSRVGQFSSVGVAILTAVVVAFKTKKTYEQNEILAFRLSTIISLSQNISSILDLKILIDKIKKVSYELTNADTIKFFIIASSLKNSEFQIETDILALQNKELKDIVYKIINDKKTILENKDLRDFKVKDKLKNGKISEKSIMGVPILYKNEVKGVFYLEKSEGIFRKDDEGVISALMTQVSISLENAQLYTNLKKNVKELEETFERLENAQEQLLHSEKMASLGELVAGIAHEINTSIGIGFSAISYLKEANKEFDDLISKQQIDKEALCEYVENNNEGLEIINNNLNRTLTLVASFKRVAVDQSNVDIRAFNVKQYLENILMALKPKLKKTSHEIIINCDDNIEIKIDPGALYQIISNFIQNAIIHAFDKNDKGCIEIMVKKENKKVCLIYKDNGKGISKENVPKLFEAFYTTNKEGGGTGLGLNIIKNLVEKSLKGTIKVESEVNVGTEFIIEFLDDL